MARRISMSQYKSRIRQLQQKQKRAIDEFNREARKYDQKVKRAVSEFNQKVNRYNTAARAYNNRVRANRDRLNRELRKLANRPKTTRFTQYRTSVDLVHSSYQTLDSYAETNELGGQYNEILDLSEREAANNVGLMNALVGDTEDLSDHEQEEANQTLLDFLASISLDLLDRWRGAIFSLDPENPDAARHFCTSAREVITHILNVKAPDSDVFAVMPECAKTQRGNPTRRAKISYFLHKKGLSNQHLEDFVEHDIDAVVRLFDVFNSATHGEAGTFDYAQLLAVRKRVEDSIVFLSRIVV